MPQNYNYRRRLSPLIDMPSSSGRYHNEDMPIKMDSEPSLNSIELVENALQDLIVDAGRRRVGWCQGEPITKSGKRRQIAKMMALLLVPVAALLAISSYFVAETLTISTQNEATRKIIKFSIELGEVLKMLQLERDQSVLYLSNIGPATKTFLLKQYLETNEYIDQLSMWPGELQDNANEYVRSRKKFRIHLTQHRNNLELYNFTVFAEVQFYNELITIFHKWLYKTLDESRYSTMWKSLVAYQKIIFARLDVGVERALGVVFFSNGGFPEHSTFMRYILELNVFRHSFRTAQNFSSLVKPIEMYDVATISGQNLTTIIDNFRHQIQYQNISQPSLAEARYWFDNMTSFIDILFDIQTELAAEIIQLVNDKQSSTVGKLGVAVFVAVIAVAMLPALTQAVHRTISDIQSFAIILADKTKDLDREKAKTDSLLNQMLPKQVAHQLKQGIAVRARYYRQVTVFFSDIVGFTGMTTKCSPLELVSLLNDLYRLFDSRIDLYDVYKVETIGDSYMVASGLPTRNGLRHASEIANMSLDLLDASSEVKMKSMDCEKVRLRIGVHSGPVVAGIVGSKLPRYCLFGDTVNTASRMETNGLPNKIHISQRTYTLLKRQGGFRMSQRGTVDVKGKGKTVTYWLDGKRSSTGEIPKVETVDDPYEDRSDSNESCSNFASDAWVNKPIQMSPINSALHTVSKSKLCEERPLSVLEM